ncbi:MAG: hypothetical protein LBE59_00285 [Nevskiaceae bacterium]|jgi:hypothetical protein|nr:hypothetical protein [Nevskiaceae bacterium]
MSMRALMGVRALICAVGFCAAQLAAAMQAPPRASNAPDTPGTGPFAAMKEEIPALPRNVVYRPADLGSLGAQKLGVVVWGNGGCSNDAASTRFHLLELASHGYLVIAAGRILSGPGAPASTGERAAFPPTVPEDLLAGIDWALAENQRVGSAYFGRIDPAQVAVSGFSCGGLQAILVAADPRVRTALLHNTGTFEGEREAMPGFKVPKDSLKRFHTPVLYVIGGPTDIAYVNAMDDFRLIDHVPVAIANLPVGHGGTYSEPNGGAAAQVAVDWLNWQLRGDAKAAARFVGEKCGLCTDSKWTLERKNFPAR